MGVVSLLTLFILLSCSGGMMPSQETDLKEDNLRGPVKQVTSRIYSYDGGRVGGVYRGYDIEYDNHGNRVSFVYYTLGDNGKLVEYQRCMYANAYDKNGVLVAREVSCKTGDKDYYRQMSLKRDGLNEEATEYNEDGSESISYHRRYLKSGEVETVTTYIEKSLYSFQSNKYDKDGRLTESRIQYLSADAPYKEQILKCDFYYSFGKARELRYDDGKEVPTATSDWSQDSDGRILRRLTYEGQTSFEVYNSKLDLIEKQSCEDGETILTEAKNDYQYDDFGNWVIANCYYGRDGSGRYYNKREIKYFIVF